MSQIKRQEKIEMDKNFTEIVCIIDKSGSMASIKDDAIGGFNNFLEEQKKVKGKAHLTLVLFDTDYQLVYDATDINRTKPLDEHTYKPEGTTALLDTIGRTVDKVGDRLANTPEDKRPGAVIVAILTDGMENASRKYEKNQIFDMIKRQENDYNWSFVFLAANQDAIATALSYGISRGNAMNYADTSMGMSGAMHTMSNTVLYRRQAVANSIDIDSTTLILKEDRKQYESTSM